MNARRSHIGTWLQGMLNSAAPAFARLGQALTSSLDTPSGRALRKGGDAVVRLAQDRANEGGKGVAVIVAVHGFGDVPESVTAQAVRAAQQVVIAWDASRESPRWN